MKNRAEQQAAWHYRFRGYRIVGTNVWAGGNEIDVIARRGRRLVFCEVKSKGGVARGDPLEMIGAEKERRLRRAAETWLSTRPEFAGLQATFDVVAVRDGKLERVRDAFV
jgi:putative endonuclease